MILYDENYKFLGASKSELNRFGFEDIVEFKSFHKDFAELFVKDDNYIYNFDNFSWIDFILYGGANKDNAIVKNKKDEYKKVKIKITPIELINSFCECEKLYKIKLEDLGEVSKDEKEKLTKSNIDVNTMLKDSSKELKKDNENNDLDINLSFMNDKDVKVDDKATISSISLDFLKNKQPKVEQSKTPLVKKEEDKLEKDVNENDKDIVLNFFNSDVENSKPSTTIQKEEESKVKDKKSKFNLNFLSKKEDKKEDKSVENKEQKTEVKDKPKQDLNLNFLKTEDESKKEDETPNSNQAPSLNLNFLKTEDKNEPKEPIQSQQSEEVKPDINLNFLKTEDKSVENKEQKTEVKDKPKQDLNLNFLKTEDESKKEDETPNSNQAPSLNLNFLKTEDKNEPKEPIQSQQSEEVKPDINLNFIKNQEDIVEKEIKETPSLNLNLLKTEETKPNEEKKELTTQEKSTIIKQIKNDIEEIDDTPENFSFLANVDISIEEKKEILNDFIDDSMQTLSLVEKFILNNDFDSTNFMIKKISSSADLLELKAVSKNLNQLYQSISSENKEDIQKYIQKCIDSIKNLKNIKI